MLQSSTYLRYIQFKILNNRLVTQTLLKKLGKSESESCLYCKEKDTQVHVLPYCPLTIQLWRNVEKGWEKLFNPITKCVTGIKCLAIQSQLS